MAQSIFSDELNAYISEWKDKPGNLIMILHRVQVFLLQRYGEYLLSIISSSSISRVNTTSRYVLERLAISRAEI